MVNPRVRLVLPAAARAIAASCDDAYSFNNYSPAGWRGCALECARRGMNPQQIEAVLRSKWTRWAADGSPARYGRHTGADLARFLNLDCCDWGEVEAMTADTFPLMATRYIVSWDNGAHACGSFPDRFDTFENADAYGREWADECNLRDFGTTEPEGDCYSYDVLEVETPDPEADEHPDPIRDGWVGKDGKP